MNPSGPQGQARGRARGRARGNVPQQPAQPGQPTQAQGYGNPQSQSRASHRGGDRPGGLQGRSGGAANIEGAMGGLKISGSTSSGNGNGNGNGPKPAGRGVMRGNREVSSQIVWTKPSTVSDKVGSTGQTINLYANYFLLQKRNDWLLCLYHVEFNPEEDRTFVKKKLLRQHEKYLGKDFLFDGMQLYMSHKLANNVNELTSKDETGQIFKITIKFIKELSPYDCQFIQILNILLRRCQEHLGLQLMGRNYYNPNAESSEPQYNIKIWPGFSTAIRQFEHNILLNVDVTHKFLRTENVLNSLKGNQRMKPTDLLGNIVMTTYNKKTYRIDDFDLKTNPRSTFPYRGAEKSYADYYFEKYKIKIRDLTQPMIMSKPKKRDIRRGMTENLYLVPELCVLTGLSDEMRNDFHIMRNLAGYMRMTPDRRVMALKQFNSDLSRNPQVSSELTTWGLKIQPELVKVQGRVLPPEKIGIGESQISYNPHQADWSREMRNKRMNTPMDLTNWACVFPERIYQDAENLVSTLVQVGAPMGMRISMPDMMSMRGDHVNDYVNQLRACAGKQMVLIVLMNNRGDRYGAIKKFLSCTLAVPSQCILARTLGKKGGLMSIATKVAIQMNCKLGGDVWNVAIPLKECMVIGYDTYHDSLKKGSSYGAVVSSMNHGLTKYFGQVARHQSQEELTDNFSASVKRSLEAYKSINRKTPGMVIVFRDGVGEGQIGYVKDHEIAAIKNCFEMACDTPPKFAFVIVSKRINTRLLLPGQQGIGNPPPGTVVDNTITLPERYDFFLISQSVNQGTVSPTSFNVIEDTSGLKPDHMQRLAYKLTHLYYNWQGTVRVPAPCLYAHKLAYLTGTAIHEQPHHSMANKLWYL